MSKSLRIHLLIPYLDGEYYGTIFTTLLRETRKRNAVLYTIQALASVENPAAFDYHIGMDVADGWLLVTSPHSVLPSSPRLLEAIHASGKPVVTIGYEEKAIPCQSVIINNRQAIKDVVSHLIRDHGHRRIAFVGGKEHVDLIERYEGYKEALLEHGIAYEDVLHYDTENALHIGGVSAANEMLQRGVDFTAVVAATDLNAMGVIEGLQAAGYKVPNDIAVIGFDDIPSSEAFVPPLTSVHQPIADLARTSIELLFRQIDGEVLQHSVTNVPTQFVKRSSCGCAYRSKRESIEVMERKLLQVETNIKHLVASHNQLASNWASAAREDFFDIAKMFRGISSWGFLATWEKNETDHKHLIVKQTFSHNGAPVPHIGESVSIEQFPPSEWLPAIGEHEFVRVQFIRSDKEDIGFIVLVGPIDKLVLLSEVDITRISCNVAVTALVRDQLFDQVQSIAEQLEIVSRTTNDGIWDLDLTRNQITWSTRAHDMICSIGETLTGEPDSILRLIHPDDYLHVYTEVKEHIIKNKPLKMEFRIRGQEEGQILWLYVAGDSVLDDNGNKVRVIGSITNITEKKQAEKQITQLAYHDGLTNLPNRLLFRERFLEYKAEADLYGYKLGVMQIDLDRFKIINDTLGHQVGDQLLKEVARMLEEVVLMSAPDHPTGYDRGIVARLGGDEFNVLVSRIQDTIQLQQVADTIIQRFQKSFVVDQLELFTTASIGISVYPDDGTDLDTLTRCADIAMYKAKDNGKNRSVHYSNEFNSLTVERLKLENELRKALERGEFQLYYQPQLDLEKNKIYGVEALIRWNSSERGLISPAEFIPLAEDSGLIIPIGQWVLREACMQRRRWLDSGLLDFAISVNISASQLLQNDFVDMVHKVLIETKLPPEYVCLEVTESTAIKNWNNSIDKLHKLRQLGVRLAIDDFGTGYSSLSMLKHLPISIVKIDRSFVRDMVVNSDDAAIATAIITLARKLGLTVIAEGVETGDQQQLLMADKCHCIQGYIFSKPLPSEDCYTFVCRMDHS